MPGAGLVIPRPAHVRGVAAGLAGGVVSIGVPHKPPLPRLTPAAIGRSESAGGPVLAGLEVGSALKRLCFPVPRDGETVAAGGACGRKGAFVPQGPRSRARGVTSCRGAVAVHLAGTA